MIELDDCGKELHLDCTYFRGHLVFTQGADVKVQMVIKAPRGTMVLFDRDYISPDTQCEAIRAFMEEHSNG